MDNIKVLKMSKKDLEESIGGLTQLKPVIQKQLMLKNFEGKGKEDAKELGLHFDTAINAMITVLGLMEEEKAECNKHQIYS